MNVKRFWPVLQAILAAVFVLIGYMCLVQLEPAKAGGQDRQVSIARHPPFAHPSEPDPRWLELVKSKTASHPAVAQAGGLSVNLNLTDYFVAGRVPTLNPVTIQLVHEGSVLGSKGILPVPDVGGGFYQTALEWEADTSYYSGIVTGDEIRVIQSGTMVSVTVPNLTSYADSKLEQVFGQAPAGAALDLYLFPYLEQTQAYTETGTADGTGKYRVDWSNPGGVQPRDQGYVIFASDPERQVYVRYRAPLLKSKKWMAGG